MCLIRGSASKVRNGAGDKAMLYANRIKRSLMSSSGFSLIEIIVATAVSSVILLMIYSAHRSIMSAIHDLTGVADFYENVNLTIYRIDRDLSCAYFNKANKRLTSNIAKYGFLNLAVKLLCNTPRKKNSSVKAAVSIINTKYNRKVFNLVKVFPSKIFRENSSLKLKTRKITLAYNKHSINILIT